MKTLITGATGFAGSHFLERCRARGDEASGLVGLSRTGDWLPGFRDLRAYVRLRRFDWTSVARLKAILKQEQPDRILHLAGYTDPAGSFRDPAAAWEGNWRTTFTLLEAIKSWGGRPRALFASSGAVYGQADGRITESAELRPNSPYGASKAAADLLCHQVWKSDGLHIIRARLFNVSGPGLPDTLALGQFVRQIVAIERGEQEPALKLGDLSAERDFLDIRDALAAFEALMEHGEPGAAYNVASGVSQPMRRLVEQLLKLSTKRISIAQDPARMRPAETKKLQVEIGKLARTTGWRPQIDLAASLAEMLEAARGGTPHR